MKRVVLIALILLTGSAIAQAPTKLFDVRNGGATGTQIEYKDAAAKQAVIDAFAELGSWTPQTLGGDGQPITKQQFFHRELTALIRDRVRQARAQVAHKAVVVDESDLPTP